MDMRFHRLAKGQTGHKRGEMNKAESNYAQHLELLKRSGDILWYAYEPLNLRLAPNTFYNPDFVVMTSDGTLEVHEVKGFWQDAAKIKVKVAASTFPFRFVIVKALPKKEGGGFSMEVMD